MWYFLLNSSISFGIYTISQEERVTSCSPGRFWQEWENEWKKIGILHVCSWIFYKFEQKYLKFVGFTREKIFKIFFVLFNRSTLLFVINWFCMRKNISCHTTVFERIIWKCLNYILLKASGISKYIYSFLFSWTCFMVAAF